MTLPSKLSSTLTVRVLIVYLSFYLVSPEIFLVESFKWILPNGAVWKRCCKTLGWPV
jgi:uncharacterized membrane protein YkgB